MIGFLGVTSPETNADLWRGFHQGLKETGHVEGENVLITYRWAEISSSGCRSWRPIWSDGGSL